MPDRGTGECWRYKKRGAKTKETARPSLFGTAGLCLHVSEAVKGRIPLTFLAKRRRLGLNRNGRRQCLVLMWERKGRSLAFEVQSEGDAASLVRDYVGTLATFHADEGRGWNAPRAGWDMRRVDHSVPSDRCNLPTAM